MECCQPLCRAGPERCPRPMVLTEAVPVCPPVSVEAVPISPPRFPPSFLPPFQGSTLFNSYPRVPPFRLHPRLDSGAASRLKRCESRLPAARTNRSAPALDVGPLFPFYPGRGACRTNRNSLIAIGLGEIGFVPYFPLWPQRDVVLRGLPHNGGRARALTGTALSGARRRPPFAIPSPATG